MKKNLIFTDLDGTLEDSRQDMANAVVETRKSLGLKTEDFEAYVPNVNKGMRELTLSCFSELLKDLEGEKKEKRALELQGQYEEKYLEKIAVHTKPYEGIPQLLKELSKMGSVVVITNKPYHLSVALLQKIGLMEFVSLVVGGDSCKETKPSSVPLEWATEKLGFEKMNVSAFMMGDTAADVQCGKSFGAKTIWCAYGYSSHPGPLEPDFVVSSPLQTLELFKTLVSVGGDKSVETATSK